MKHLSLYRALLAGVLLSVALSACKNGPETYDACMLKASRESQSDRQFRKLAEACKERFPNR